MARVHGQELEITCLVTPTPEEEFQLELISQNMAYRVKETCIRLASANLEQMLREIARLQRGKGSESRADELLELEKGSGVEIVGLVGAPKHNGRQGTVGNYDAGKQRYAVSLPTCHLSGGESLPAKKLAVKAANLLPLLTTASRGDEPEGITATLWAIESKGTLLSWPGGSSVSLLKLCIHELTPDTTVAGVVMFTGQWPRRRLMSLGARRPAPSMLQGERSHGHAGCRVLP